MSTWIERKKQESGGLYKVFTSIKQRCLNPRCDMYPGYGGRGITLCDEWKDDREAFIRWAKANGYRDGLWIDRIDNDKGYSPDNCRFVTPAMSARNRRGPGLSIDQVKAIRELSKTEHNNSEIARKFGVSATTIWKIVNFKIGKEI